MSGESQLTFDDVLQPETPYLLYGEVSKIANIIGAENRNRAGDNCSTISQRSTDTDDDYTFCIQIPPKTNSITIEDIQSASDITLKLNNSSVYTEENPPYVTWTFTGQHTDANELTIIIIKPIETVNCDEEHSSYTNFDFTKFVRNK